MMGVSESGVEDREEVEGVFEEEAEERSVEERLESDADCRATLSPDSRAKPFA